MLAKDKTCRRIEQMEAEREERRRAMIERKKARNEEEQRNIAAGNPGDVDFIGLVRAWRDEHVHAAVRHHSSSSDKNKNGPDSTNNESSLYYNHPRICICVRKRPISEKETAKLDHDSVTCINPTVWIHSAKVKVDGISKYLDHSSFTFDHAFDETISTDEVYKCTTMPLVDFVCAGKGGRATVFAYGQTGSGKTHTMSGIQAILAQDLFSLLSESMVESSSSCCSLDNTRVSVSFFEMYGGYVQDLLNDRNRLKILEDGKGEIHVAGLTEMEVYDPETFNEVIVVGNNGRTTHITEANDTSSRSHAICQIMLKDRNTDKLRGKLSLVDLAGSERGTDTKSHNQQRRAESADINTSLLTLKECIRALDQNKKIGLNGMSGGTMMRSHVPYRGSKLTLILKDCFTSDQAMTTMIATVSPGASAADHSINTLRYADRIKSQGSSTSNGSLASNRSVQHGTHVRTRRRALSTNAHNNTSSNGEQQLDSSYYSDDISTRNKTNEQVPRKDEEALYNQSKQVISTRQSHRSYDTQQSMQSFEDDDAIFRRTVEAILEQEENILSTHMSNIQENADLLTVEGDLLSSIQDELLNQTSEESTAMALDDYATALEEILDRKEDMILNLQQQISNLQQLLKKEHELSEKTQQQYRQTY